MKYKYLKGKKLEKAKRNCPEFTPDPKLTREKLLKRYGKYILGDLEERLVEEMLIFIKKIDVSMLTSPYFIFPYRIDQKNGQGSDFLRFLVDITDTTKILSVELRKDFVDRPWMEEITRKLIEVTKARFGKS